MFHTWVLSTSAQWHAFVPYTKWLDWTTYVKTQSCGFKLLPACWSKQTVEWRIYSSAWLERRWGSVHGDVLKMLQVSLDGDVDVLPNSFHKLLMTAFISVNRQPDALTVMELWATMCTRSSAPPVPQNQLHSPTQQVLHKLLLPSSPHEYRQRAHVCTHTHTHTQLGFG